MSPRRANLHFVQAYRSTVLFDLDGTLLDAVQSHFRVFRSVCTDLRLPFDASAYARRYSPNWYVLYDRMGVPRERWDEADRLWLRHYAEEAPRPREGAGEILRALKESGRSVGLVTSGDRSRVERDLRCAGWQSIFDVVVCGGDVEERKPLPGPLLYALRALRVVPAASVYVGDTVEDVTMGKAAGALTAAVLGGFSTREVLAAAAPDHLLARLADLRSLLA